MYSAEAERGKTPTLRALRDFEQSPWLELQIACEVARLLSGSGTADQSFLPHPVLSSSLPKQLPKSVAMILSESEQKAIQNNASKKVWNDVKKITNVKVLSEHEVTYYNVGGVQTLAEVGRGDFNHDGIQDVLIVSRDSVEGGSYSYIRLFVFSVNKSGNWNLLEEY